MYVYYKIISKNYLKFSIFICCALYVFSKLTRCSNVLYLNKEFQSTYPCCCHILKGEGSTEGGVPESRERSVRKKEYPYSKDQSRIQWLLYKSENSPRIQLKHNIVLLSSCTVVFKTRKWKKRIVSIDHGGIVQDMSKKCQRKGMIPKLVAQMQAKNSNKKTVVIDMIVRI